MPPWLDAGCVRGAALDRRLALALHRSAAQPPLRQVLVLASRLSDAGPWVLLTLLLAALGGSHGLRTAQGLLLAGAVDLALYWALKRGTRRARPFERCEGIRACTPVPDAFSFPSGHTLHAVAFALLLSAAYPQLAPWWWGFAVLVGVSRVVLGLHYPSDVLAGAMIGAATATGVLQVMA